MKMFLDTSTDTAILKLDGKEYRQFFGHDMAEKILQFIHDKLRENNCDWQNITEIKFMSGPGSFTGLRIGATIVNALAHELNVPLYTHEGKLVTKIIPNYGRAANITTPRK